MELKIKKIEIDFNFNWECGVEISKMEDDLKKLKKMGATHIDIDSEVCHDFSAVIFSAYQERQETKIKHER